jgi:dihydroorotase
VLKRGEERVTDILNKDGVEVEVVLFKRGKQTWSVEWK